ncbi:unnamed protein product [Ambrosiozyma monospora]|uniref:Unnamed protein product n=1 Tax=Ambrosiozyma monospora TaxID=43982 RepID=A0A9W7DD01_AMBMO|nr:unnamed protein product [Ambrosiozyma monospora]
MSQWELSSSSTAVTISLSQKQQQRPPSSSSNNTQFDKYVLVNDILYPTNIPEEVTRSTQELDMKPMSKRQFINSLRKKITSITKPTIFHTLIISKQLLDNALECQFGTMFFEKDVICRFSQTDGKFNYDQITVKIFDSGFLKLSRVDYQQNFIPQVMGFKISSSHPLSGCLSSSQQSSSRFDCKTQDDTNNQKDCPEIHTPWPRQEWVPSFKKPSIKRSEYISKQQHYNDFMYKHNNKIIKNVKNKTKNKNTKIMVFDACHIWGPDLTWFTFFSKTKKETCWIGYDPFLNPNYSNLLERKYTTTDSSSTLKSTSTTPRLEVQTTGRLDKSRLLNIKVYFDSNSDVIYGLQFTFSNGDIESVGHTNKGKCCAFWLLSKRNHDHIEKHEDVVGVQLLCSNGLIVGIQFKTLFGRSSRFIGYDVEKLGYEPLKQNGPFERHVLWFDCELKEVQVLSSESGLICAKIIYV